MTTVTYLHHSGFLVETEKTALLFDYYTEHGAQDLLKEETFAGKELYIFASHAHGDHFDRSILRWDGQGTFVLSSDITCAAKNAVFLGAHEEKTIESITVRTLQSNDEGVAFLVQADGLTVFHAGDLNWWHWNGEPERFLQEIKESYCGEIDRLQGERIDIAFVPADPRLEDKYDWAVRYFAEKIGAKAIFPMHFWGNFDICNGLKAQKGMEAVQQITHAGQRFLMEEV